MLGTEAISRSQLEEQHSTHVLFAKATPAKRLPKWGNGTGSPVQTEVASPRASDEALQSSTSLCYGTYRVKAATMSQRNYFGRLRLWLS